ncbi:hypothetical protein I552_0379 [Mycobacterium xenopi 3993]|nr:hypothetical protein I552_0379 [Mycobacterium xenopi 3993]
MRLGDRLDEGGVFRRDALLAEKAAGPRRLLRGLRAVAAGCCGQTWRCSTGTPKSG